MTAGATAVRAPAPTSLLRNRPMAALLVAEVLSTTGSQMTGLALPWFVLVTTGSAKQMALVVAAETAGFALFAIPSGSLLARFGPQRTMRLCDATRAPLMLLVPLLHWSGDLTLPTLVVLAFVLGVASTPYGAAQHVIVAEILDEDEAAVERGNALLQGATRITMLCGPALGGILIAAVGSSWCFVVNAASFLAVLAALLAMRPAELLPLERGRRQSGLRALREGIAYVRASELLRVILPVGAALGAFGFSTMRTLLSVLARDTLHGGPRTFGVLFAAYGAGAVVGALAGAALSRTGRTLLVGGALLFSGTIVGLAPVHVTWLAAALLVVIGAGWATWSGQALAQVQLAAPDALRGRVISLYTYTIIASAPLGGLLGGWLAGVGGTELAFAVSGGAGASAALLGGVALLGRRVPARHVPPEVPLQEEAA